MDGIKLNEAVEKDQQSCQSSPQKTTNTLPIGQPRYINPSQ